jgi:hypothetical protein
MAKKEVFQQLAEIGQIQIKRTSLRALVSVHLIWIRPISPCNRLAKKGLQGSANIFLGLLRLAENLNWPTSRLAEITIGRKRAGGPPFARARYGLPARFRPISSIFVSALILLSVVFYSTKILSTLE